MDAIGEVWRSSRRVDRQTRRSGSTKPSSSAPVTPLTILGAALAAWYRSDLGISLNGSTVSAWADQSGNAHHLAQSSASKQPIYVASGGPGGRAYLSWTGDSSQILTCASPPALTVPFEGYLIVQCAGINADGDGHYILDVGANTDAVMQIGSGGGGNKFFNFPQNASVTPGDITLVHWVNIQYAGNMTLVVDDGSSATGSSAATNSAGLVVGSYGGDLGILSFGGKMQEVVLATRALTAGERSQLQSYFAALYGTS